MKLRDTQNSFQDHILRSGQNIDQDFATICENGNIPLNERLRVYKDSVVGGLAVTLTETFPTLLPLAGEDFTHDVLRAYVRTHPPRTGNLEDYGESLPDFIASLPTAKQLPYLADLMRLDWFLNASEQATDDTPLEVTDLEDKQKTENPELPLRANVLLLSSNFPLSDIREFTLDPDNETKTPPDLQSGGEYLLIHRPRFKAEILKITEAEYAFLFSLKENASLPNALQTVLEKHPEFDFAKTLQKYLALQIFSKD